MSEAKKYFYLKVKETFFDSEEMKIIESQKNGIVYQNLYLKLSLLSLKSEGALLFKDAIPYDEAMLSSILRIDIDTVRVGLELFKNLHLVEILDNGTIFMSDIQTMLGQSSNEAERVKAYRERIKIESKEGVLKRTNVQNRTPELELDTELKTEHKGQSEQVLLYLNERAKKKFRPTKSNLGFIEARLKEKYTFDDFKRVIDLKCLKWLKNPEMADYLRPSTLFSPKNFDAYLNESPVNGSYSASSSDDSNFIDPKKQDRRSTSYIMYVMKHPEFDPEIYEEYRPNRKTNAS